MEVTDQCGNCHGTLGKTYFDTMHGKAYLLGYLKAAKCSDCHGAHDTVEVNDPNSQVGFNRVVKTCQKCHPDASRRFTGYLTHATHHDKAKYPILYITFWGMTSLLWEPLVSSASIPCCGFRDPLPACGKKRR